MKKGSVYYLTLSDALEYCESRRNSTQRCVKENAILCDEEPDSAYRKEQYEREVESLEAWTDIIEKLSK